MKHQMLRFAVYFCLLLAPVLAFAGLAYGDAEITLAWDANIESDLAGYRLYQRAESEPNYDFNLVTVEIPAGTETCTITIPEENEHQFFVITAYDVHGNESGISNEVSCFIDTIGPAPPKALAITKIIRY